MVVQRVEGDVGVLYRHSVFLLAGDDGRAWNSGLRPGLLLKSVQGRSQLLLLYRDFGLLMDPHRRSFLGASLSFDEGFYFDSLLHLSSLACHLSLASGAAYSVIASYFAFLDLF